MLIDFKGYTLDCLISGRLELTASRLTDMLNDAASIALHDVVLEGLVDGAIVRVPEFTLQRDELLAARATGPRGSAARRIATIPHRLQAQIGPYTVLGRLHAPPGISAGGSLYDRGPMLPLTDATIAYVIGGVVEVRDAATLIVNRDLASWLKDVETGVDVDPATRRPVLPPGRRPVGATGDVPTRHTVRTRA